MMNDLTFLGPSDKRQLNATVDQLAAARDRGEWQTVEMAARDILAVIRKARPSTVVREEIDPSTMHPETRH